MIIWQFSLYKQSVDVPLFVIAAEEVPIIDSNVAQTWPLITWLYLFWNRFHLTLFEL